MFGGEAKENAEVFREEIQSVSALRACPWIHPEVFFVPYLFQRACESGNDSWRCQVQLVDVIDQGGEPNGPYR